MLLKSGLQTGLLGALALVGFGCAQIIGADFDKPFQTGGAGGGATATAATGGGATSAGGAGGMSTGVLVGATATSTGTGGDVIAQCPDNQTDTCDIHVYLKPLVPGSPGHITADAVLTFETMVPAGFDPSPVSAFRLYKSPPVSNGVPLFSCLYDDVQTSHFVSKVFCPNGALLGYAVENMSGNPGMYGPLLWFSTNAGSESNHHHRALIATTDQDALCPATMPYGICGSSDLYAPL